MKLQNPWRLPTEEFFLKRSKHADNHNFENYGTIKWEMAVALLGVWFIIFLGLMRGIRVYGKVNKNIKIIKN